MQTRRVVFPVIVVLLMVLSLPMSIMAQEDEVLVLAEHGPYGVGWRSVTFVDESREDRELQTMIWYPAIIPAGQEEDRQMYGLFDAEPDTEVAPYPLILWSPGYGGSKLEGAYLKGHLASYGFVVVGMMHPGDTEPASRVDRPLDILFVLDQLSLDMEDLTDVLDMNVVGVIGYSDGSYSAMSVAGARLDPEYFFAWFEDDESNVPVWVDSQWIKPWDEIVQYRAQFDPPPVEGELWPPFADDRIRAVMPMAPCEGHAFGNKGLAAIEVPTFLMAGTRDRSCPYDGVVYTYEYLGADDRYLLSFINKNHSFPGFSTTEDTIKHFALAFFGKYLQGNEDYTEYLTEDFVEQFESLVWGVYEEE